MRPLFTVAARRTRLERPSGRLYLQRGSTPNVVAAPLARARWPRTGRVAERTPQYRSGLDLNGSCGTLGHGMQDSDASSAGPVRSRLHVAQNLEGDAGAVSCGPRATWVPDMRSACAPPYARLAATPRSRSIRRGGAHPPPAVGPPPARESRPIEGSGRRLSGTSHPRTLRHGLMHTGSATPAIMAGLRSSRSGFFSSAQDGPPSTLERLAEGLENALLPIPPRPGSTAMERSGSSRKRWYVVKADALGMARHPCHGAALPRSPGAS